MDKASRISLRCQLQCLRSSEQLGLQKRSNFCCITHTRVSHKGLKLLVKVLDEMLVRLTGDKKLQDQPKIPNVQMHSLAPSRKVSRVADVLNSNTNNRSFWGDDQASTRECQQYQRNAYDKERPKTHEPKGNRDMSEYGSVAVEEVNG